jgi:hypothetical protein
MKKIYTLLLLSIATISSPDAQQTNGLAAFVKSGLYSLSSSALNKIAPAGFNLKHNTSVTLGAEGYYRGNKMLFILDGNVGLENSKVIGSQAVKLYSESIFGKAGWVIKEKKHYWIYPSIGIGIASLEVNMYDEKNELVNNLGSHLINNASVEVGINADFIFKKTADPIVNVSMLSGLRAGYRLSVKNKTWRNFDGNKIYGMPSYAQNGFYVTLAIGYGVFIKN